VDASLSSNPKILNEKSCFETKMFASLSSKPKSLRKSLATKQKSCFEVKAAGQISYFKTIMLEISLALKPKC